MKSLNNYIYEARERQAGGRFKNSGSDILSMIVKFVERCMRTVQGMSLIGTDIGSAITPNGNSYILDINKLKGIAPGSLPEIGLYVNSLNRKMIPYCQFFTTVGEVANMKLMGIDDNDLETIKNAFPEAGHAVAIENSTVSSFEDCPTPTGNIKYGAGGDRLIAFRCTEVKDLSGCPDCIDLRVSDNKILYTLAGSDIKCLEQLDAGDCPSLKTLKGAPMMCKDVKRITLSNCPELDLKTLPGILPKGCSVGQLDVDGESVLRDGCKLEGVKVRLMNIWVPAGNITVDTSIVDMLPDNITGNISILGRGKILNKKELSTEFKRKYPMLDIYFI